MAICVSMDVQFLMGTLLPGPLNTDWSYKFRGDGNLRNMGHTGSNTVTTGENLNQRSWTRQELIYSLKRRNRAVSNCMCTHEAFNHHVYSSKLNNVAAAVQDVLSV